MYRFFRRRWSHALAFLLAIALAVLTVAPSLASAQQATEDRQAALTGAIRQAGLQAYEMSARGYLQRAVARLTELADLGEHGVPPAVLADLAEAAESAFYDGARLDQAGPLYLMQRSAHHIALLWQEAALYHPAAMGALTDLLMAIRQTADLRVADMQAIVADPSGQVPEEAPLAGIAPEDWARATADYLAARAARDQAMAALDAADLLGANRAFAQAWERARSGFGTLAIPLAPAPDADRDGDLVPDFLELRLGASPLRADTDGDGLSDDFEIRSGFPWILPGLADSDADGISDADEDLDGDGLTNLQEQSLGTDPLKADSDKDGLDDGEEAALGTDPLSADSDGDGLDDGTEVRLGLDPLNPDSDGDGVLDGSDVLTGTVTTPTATVEITGEGDVAGTVRVASLGDEVGYQNLPGLASDVVEITAGAPFASARVELPVDLSRVPAGDVAGLQVMYFDEAARRWTPVEGAQGFDPVTGRAWAVTTHFTKYAVFYIPDWDAFWTVPRCKPKGGEEPLYIDLALAIDSSGSMTWNDPDGLRKVGAKLLIDSLWEQDQVAVIDFDSYGYVRQSMTTDKAAAKAAVDLIDSWGGTNIAWGVYLGLSELVDNGNPEHGRLMVLLTDGVGYYDHAYTDAAVAHEVAIYTIGLGYEIDPDLLQEIATRTGGQYYHVTTAADLPDAFERISEDTGIKDSDGDGLPDCAETGGMPDPNGRLWFSNPNEWDSDGDGLSDAFEVGLAEPSLTEILTPPEGEGQSLGASPLTFDLPEPATPETGHYDEPESFGQRREAQLKAGTPIKAADEAEEPVVYYVVSDPMSADTDGDGLEDDAEFENGTPPMLADADGDGVGDYDELVHGTDPFDLDTDGDGLDDRYEIAHADDGFDPLVVDERMTAEEWAAAYGKGLAFGETCDTILSFYEPCQANVPFFLGSLTGGTLSFIPVVGWIVGLVADLRDAIGSALKGDWAGAAFSLAGVLPYVGDVAKLVAKVIDFIALGTVAVILLRSLYQYLPDLLGEGDPDLSGQGMAISGAGPPIQTMGMGSKTKELLLEIGHLTDPAAMARLADRFGDDPDLLAKLVLLGPLDEMADLFDRLGDLFADPQMAGFIKEMIQSASSKVIFNKGVAEKLSLDGKVTIHLKKATGQIKGKPADYVENYIQRMRNHLRGAQAEHGTYARYPTSGPDIIPLHHVTATGPDRVIRQEGIVKVLEVKAMESVGWNDVKGWFTVEKVGKQNVVKFNGKKLDRHLRRHDVKLKDIAEDLHFDVYIHKDGGAIDGELAQLFNQGSVEIAGFGTRRIQLGFTSK